MTKYLSGKKYDTSTAKELANRSDGEGFTRLRETLFRKNSGEFFLYGEGGALTMYSRKQCDGSVGWGEKIVPLTFEQAQEWAEMYLDGGEYEEIFGSSDFDVDGDKRTVSFYLSSSVIIFAKNQATANKQSFSGYIEDLIRKDIDKHT